MKNQYKTLHCDIGQVTKKLEAKLQQNNISKKLMKKQIAKLSTRKFICVG